MELSDEIVIKQILAGDIESYAILVKRYQRDVIKVVSAMLFCRQESEDLVQNTFLKAFANLDKFDKSRDFAKWVKGIARNSVRMHLRKSKTNQGHLSTYREWVLSHDTEQGNELEERNEALNLCRAELNEDNQSILDMRYGDRMSMSEIGELLGRSKDAITKVVSRLRADLRRCIKRRFLEQ